MALARRSLLYVPASAEAMVRKAGSRGADVLILDLEDGVHPDRKEEARDRAVRLSREPGLFGRSEVWLRTNAPGTPWHEADLAAAAGAAVSGVVIPKCEDPEEVRRLAARLGEGRSLFLMVETAAGILRSPDLARAAPPVAGLVFGAADYRESLRAGRMEDELELLVARTQLVQAARAAGVDVFDTPWFEYRDLEGLARSARRARALGFDGKTAIHPGQVAAVNAVFTPTAEEVERARRVIGALEDQARLGQAVAVLDGEMVEALHGRGARRVLEKAGLI